MSRIPEYRRWGYRPNGPGKCICPKCHATISTNALARVAHEDKHVRDAEKAKQAINSNEEN